MEPTEKKSKELPKELNRHEMRVLAMEALYKHLLTGKDIRACVFDLTRTNHINGYLYSLTMGTCEHENDYEKLISEHLRKDWTFDRLSKLEQAILLMSTQEILENQTEKPVVINEAVTLAKKYCDDNSYKLINGILDRL